MARGELRKIDNVLQAAADPERRKLPECISWLERYLESGAKMSRDVYAQKFSEATVRRAAAKLGVESFKTREGWMIPAGKSPRSKLPPVGEFFNGHPCYRHLSQNASNVYQTGTERAWVI